MECKALVHSYRDEIIDKITRLVSYPSVMGEASKEYPFGKVVADCLEEALGMAEKYGFQTVNLDNYAGYAQIGEGDQVIGILGHLDVVPAGEGWTSDPFQVTIRDGKLYGRGTTDDKGAVVCSMVAMKIVKQLVPNLSKRIRLIMGCNEENGSECLKYYVQKEGHVDYGFTPDGNFPGIHGEKGMVHGYFKGKTTKLLSIEGGVAGNVVPNKVVLVIPSGSFDKKRLELYFGKHQVKFQMDEVPAGISLTVFGTAAHASLPHLGVNAISHAMCALYEAGFEDPFVSFYARRIGLSYHGEYLNIDLADEFGRLTFNVGTVRKEGDEVIGSIDIRFPIRFHVNDVVEPLLAAAEEPIQIVVKSSHEPLFFEVDSPLVQMLSSAYYEVTKDYEHKVETIGGGTYAKGIQNTIAFGCEFPGDDCHIHDADEFVEIEKLLLQTEIYVVALLNLLKA